MWQPYGNILGKESEEWEGFYLIWNGITLVS